MIRHEAICADMYIPQLAGFNEEIDKTIIVFIFGKNYFVSTTAIHDMIPGAWIFYS